jgi:hypothetical protein
MEDRLAGTIAFLLGVCAAASAALTFGYFLHYGLGFSRLQILHCVLAAAAVISGIGSTRNPQGRFWRSRSPCVPYSTRIALRSAGVRPAA